MRFPNDVITIKEHYFLHDITRGLFRAISALKQKELSPDIDTIITHYNDLNPEPIDFATVKKIKDGYDNFDNIAFCKKELKSDYFKFTETSSVMEDLLTATTSRGYLKPEQYTKFADRFRRISYELDDSRGAVNTKELVRLHKEDYVQRGTDLKKRTLGYSDLDNTIVPALGEGQIYIGYADKGSGKSVFVKNIESALINRGTCVLSFNPEMPLISIMDRIVCMRGGFNKRQLFDKNLDPRTVAKIKRVWEEFESLPNYMYSAEPHFTFAYMESEIERCREIFRQLGVLPADGYMVVTVDLLSMAKDFGDKSPGAIENGMDNLHEIVRRLNVPLLGVIQQNENKFRGNNKIIKKPEELDFYRPNLEDIKGGAAYAERARVVFSMYRPLFLKERYFPDQRHIWEMEPDLLHINVVKNNDGNLGYMKMLFQGENFRVLPYQENVVREIT